MITINGKSYPLWSHFIEGKDEWIGGTLEEFSDGICDGGVTEITDITLEQDDGLGCVNFTVHGKDFDNSFNVEYGGVSGGDGEWLNFAMPMGMGFRIKKHAGKNNK